MTKLNTLLAHDNDEYHARRFAHQILGLMSRYIPDACHREVSMRLYEWSREEGVELTNKAMRKEYEAWKKLTLPTLATTVIPTGVDTDAN